MDTVKKQLEEILEQVDQQIYEPLIDARFGHMWKENAKEHYDLDTVISIAWRQGRKAILLERVIEKLLKQLNDGHSNRVQDF